MSVILRDPMVARRRAIEALRSGVPSREAVAALGSAQTEIEDRFSALLDALRAQPGAGQHPGGMLVGGEFGSGKSHLLEHLTHLATSNGFIVSKVVVSKETPLHDPVKVFRAAIESAIVPDQQGSALAEVAASLQTDTPAYGELFRWVHSRTSGLNERFAASLFLYARLREGDEEFAELIVRFWSGDPIRVPDLRKRLRELGEAATYPLPAISQRELALQRFRFVSRLMRAAGYAGWIVLVDEVELIGRYSVLARAKSYAELARWIRGSHEDAGVPLGAVLAITADFEAAVIETKNDKEMVPARLRARQSAEYDLLAGQAEAGMRIIGKELVRIKQPDAAELDRTYRRLKEIHGEAFGWDPPEVAGLEVLSNTRMRQYVRAWINEWDLVRLDPAYQPQTETVEIAMDYTEDTDLDVADS